MSDSLAIACVPVGGNGTLKVTVERADEVLFVDEVNCTVADERERFTGRIRDRFPNADHEALLRRLDSHAASVAEGKSSALPEVVLPGGSAKIVHSGSTLGELLGATGRFYTRGGAVVTLRNDDEGQRVLSPVPPAALASALEEVAQLQKWMKEKKEFVKRPSICNESTAKLILHAESFRNALPPIRVISPCPALIERGGKLIEVCGYDRESGVLAAGTVESNVELEAARDLLDEIVQDFTFATPSDRSRALASIITHGLNLGNLLTGRAPIDLGEADDSQAGKGYRNQLTAAIYKDKIKAITQKKGGVGSLEESFNAALIAGRPIISLDNVRGRIDSPAIESFCTEDSYLARIPFAPSMEINPRRFTIMFTSNNAEVTTDLANRSSTVRIRKHGEDYKYASYPAGDLLDHIRENQPLFLGAVFSIIRAWHAQGKPGTDETRHDFRKWAQPLDWIVRNLLGCAPLLDGHREAQQRMANPALGWLREVAIAVKRAGKLGRELRAWEILDLIEGRALIPGLGESDDLHDEATNRRVLQAIGRELAKCFREAEVVAIDSITAQRLDGIDANYRVSKAYVFSESRVLSETR